MLTGSNSYLEFPKALYWVHYFSISLLVMYFFEIQKSSICNFADDNTLYNCIQDLQTVIENLTFDVKYVLTWFRINSESKFRKVPIYDCE